MNIKPKFRATEEALATRVRAVEFFSVGAGSGLRDHLTPGNTVSVLRCFFPNRRTMMAWLILEWIKGAWEGFKWQCFWTWHSRIMRRTKSQIEVILDNKFRKECGAEETDGIEDFQFEEEMEDIR